MSDQKKFELSPSVSILAAGVLIAAAILFVNRFPTQAADAQNNLPANVAVTPPSAQDHIIGSPTAPLVLIEYSDFQCFYCAQAYPTFKRIIEESKGAVSWVIRNFPLESIHPQARPAALAAECIWEQLGNDGYWKFADAVFADQNSMNPAHYAELATQFGANTAQFNSCVASAKYASKIDAEAAEAMGNGATGTPFTVIQGNGLQVPVSGALPYEQFKAVIKAIQSRQ